ncbi:MAG TPA: glycerophosphodiester phosphodiesterase [Solirubrobacterales bacterium]|nr:glycerophosphodiester phosphodiesterase [Solirubrobacterales bacterium]
MLRIGHKGADLIEPGNTLASFDAALAHGVDMIELDVLPTRPDGLLILAHDYEDAAERQALSIEDGFSHLASERFAGIEFIVDLKLPGYETRVVDALVAAGLRDRALVSSTYKESLARLRAYDRGLRIGWSVPRARRDYTTSVLMKLPALVFLSVMRRVFPRQAGEALRAGLCDAVMAHWRLVTPALVESVTAAGGDLYVWTVDEAPRIRELKTLGVTGVITNDPRLFAALP